MHWLLQCLEWTGRTQLYYYHINPYLGWLFLHANLRPSVEENIKHCIILRDGRIVQLPQRTGMAIDKNALVY